MVIFQGFLYVYQRVSQIIKGGIFNPGQPCFTHNQASLTHQASCGKNGTPPDQRSTPLEAPEDHNWFQCLPKFHGDFYRTFLGVLKIYETRMVERHDSVPIRFPIFFKCPTFLSFWGLLHPCTDYFLGGGGL